MRIAPAFLAIILVACAGPGSDVADTAAADTSQAAGAAGSADSLARNATTLELRTDKDRYAPGATVTLTVVNGTGDTYAFNPCTRMVQQEGTGDWRPVDEPQRVCTMEAWLVEPHTSRSGDTELPGTLEAGRYRVGLSLSRQGQAPATEHALVVSEPFMVAR